MNKSKIPEEYWYIVRFSKSADDYNFNCLPMFTEVLWLENFAPSGKCAFRDKDGKIYLILYRSIYSMFPVGDDWVKRNIKQND